MASRHRPCAVQPQHFDASESRQPCAGGHSGSPASYRAYQVRASPSAHHVTGVATRKAVLAVLAAFFCMACATTAVWSMRYSVIASLNAETVEAPITYNEDAGTVWVELDGVTDRWSEITESRSGQSLECDDHTRPEATPPCREDTVRLRIAL